MRNKMISKKLIWMGLETFEVDLGFNTTKGRFQTIFISSFPWSVPVGWV